MDKAEAVKKGVETMKMNQDSRTLKDNQQPKKEVKVLKKEDIETLLQNLYVQLNQYTKESDDKRTMAIKTQGAIEIANAQLKGLEDDSESTN